MAYKMAAKSLKFQLNGHYSSEMTLFDALGIDLGSTMVIVYSTHSTGNVHFSNSKMADQYDR